MPRVRPPPLSGWTVLSLRPRSQHAGLRAASARTGARLLALSVLAIRTDATAATRNALVSALAADVVVFTSPNAVRAAAALHPFRSRRGQCWLAVGAGTRRALQRHGISAQAPARMDSEGLLALPALADLRSKTVGLVTGRGGRGVLEPTLRGRVGTLTRADVYARETVALGTARRSALATALRRPRRVLLALTSGEALAVLLAQVESRRLRQIAVVAASARLANAARAAGFAHVAVAASARPSTLLRSATDAFT